MSDYGKHYYDKSIQDSDLSLGHITSFNSTVFQSHMFEAVHAFKTIKYRLSIWVAACAVIGYTLNFRVYRDND